MAKTRSLNPDEIHESFPSLPLKPSLPTSATWNEFVISCSGNSRSGIPCRSAQACPMMELNVDEAVTTMFSVHVTLSTRARNWRGAAGDDFHRQSHPPGELNGRHQNAWRNDCAGCRPTHWPSVFGSALWQCPRSRGSVVPLFKRQIARGGRYGDASDMKRYFMTIRKPFTWCCRPPAMGKGGETFVLNMGTGADSGPGGRPDSTSGLEPDGISKLFSRDSPGENWRKICGRRA